MKNVLKKFESARLSKMDMKSIQGGKVITCHCEYDFGVVSGSCAGPSAEVCSTYECSGGGVMLGCL